MSDAGYTRDVVAASHVARPFNRDVVLPREVRRGQTKCRGLIKGKEVSGMWGYCRVEHVVYISARTEYQSDEAVTPVCTHWHL